MQHNEELLLSYVREACEGLEVMHRARLPELQGLELDVWIPKLKIGLEYQGIQHYEAQDHWGGMEALRGVQERDERKKQLCEELGIVLLEFRYNERLDADDVYKRLLLAQIRRDVAIDEFDLPEVKLRPSGPDWVMLNGRQKLGVLLELWVLEQMERKHVMHGLNRSRAAEWVAGYFVKQWPEYSGRAAGTSASSIYNRYAKWRKLKRGLVWQDGLKYRGLILEKEGALEKVGLTEELARRFLQSWRYGIAGWAREHGVKRDAVEGLFKPDRKGDVKVARLILDSMSQRERELLHKTRKARKLLASAKRSVRKYEAILRRLDDDLVVVNKR
jgi:hypothetical protein